MRTSPALPTFLRFDRHLLVTAVAMLVILAFAGLSSAQEAGDDTTADTPKPKLEEHKHRHGSADKPDGERRFSQRQMRFMADWHRQQHEREARGGGGWPGHRGVAMASPLRDGEGGEAHGPEGRKADREARSPEGRRGGRAVRELMRGVEPTEEQREQIRTVFEESAGPMREYMRENAEALTELREEMKAARDAKDTEGVKAAREKLRELMEAAPRPDREAVHAQLREVLTADQQAVFDENLAALQERMEKARSGEGRRGENAEGKRKGKQGDGERRGNGEGRPDDAQSNAAQDEQLDL